MALDELKDDDEKFDNGGVTFLVNKELLEQVKPIKVDFVESPLGARFNIVSKLSAQTPEGSSCGACSC
jgi:Fe-S cluster assembly iron-binding protein IscA